MTHVVHLRPNDCDVYEHTVALILGKQLSKIIYVINFYKPTVIEKLLTFVLQ
jgi:hypothetical protein